jgi:hypothetical protein
MHMVINVTGTTDQAPAVCETTDVPWLGVSPASGSTPAGGSSQVTVSIDSTGLPVGTHEAVLCIQSNDPATPTVEVPVTLEVEQTQFPAIDVSPDSLTAEVPAGSSADQALTVSNTGEATLDWSIGEALPLGVNQALLEEGVLLVPDSTNDQVMAFDPDTGDLLDPAFIPFNEAAGLATPIQVVLNAERDGFLLSDQVADVVNAYDLEGNWQGVFAPAGGPNTAIVDNMRGIHVMPDGTLLVTVASGANAHSVASFDTGGTFTGNFVANGAGGLSGPWSIVFRDDDVLVSASGSSAVHRYALDGTPLGLFHDGISFPEQMQELDNGNILVAQFSGTTSGVWELAPDGTLIDIYSAVDGNRGVRELGNGNILTTEAGGVHEIDRAGNLVETKISGVGARFISHIQLEPSACDTLADVPWLGVSPASGSTPAGGSSQVTVGFDASGLDPGVFEAVLCVQSNDPATPLVEVPVTLTVTEPGGVVCDETIIGVFPGPLTVSEGTTCLAAGAQVLGEVNVLEGAGLIATAAVIQGPVSAIGAARVDVAFSQITGPVLVLGVTDTVSLFGTQVTGQVNLVGNTTVEPATVAGNVVIGSLSCFGNQPDPTNHGLTNTATGGKFGQCAGL